MSIQISNDEYKSLMRRTKKKTSPPGLCKVNPTVEPTIETSGFKSKLKSAIVIDLIGNNVNSRSIIHRPIGKTDLADDDWVFSYTSEIPNMLKRSIDPFEQAISDWANAELNRFAVSKLNGMTLEGTNLRLPSGLRKDVKNAANITAKAAYKATHPPLTEEERKEKKVRTEFDKDVYLTQLSEKDRKTELGFLGITRCQELREAIKGVIPPSGFVTTKGDSVPVRQSAIKGLKGLDRDIVLRKLELSITSGKAFAEGCDKPTEYKELEIGTQTKKFLLDNPHTENGAVNPAVLAIAEKFAGAVNASVKAEQDKYIAITTQVAKSYGLTVVPDVELEKKDDV